MSVRDMYMSMLEKRAAEDGAVPLHGNDDQQVANAELGANVRDQRQQLNQLFSKAPQAQKEDTKLINRSLPIAKKTEGTASSNPLLKVAMNQAFFSALQKTDLLKTASADYLRTAYVGFQDEFDKIAMVTALKGVAQRAAKTLGKKSPKKAWGPGTTLQGSGGGVPSASKWGKSIGKAMRR